MPRAGQLEGLIGYGRMIRPVASTGLITSNLIVHLDASNTSSYPGSGTTWTDLTGTGNNGTLTNGPTYSALAGGCIDFDGSNDYVSIASNSGLQPQTATPITMQIWIYFDSMTGGAIVNKLTGSFGFDGYILRNTNEGYVGYTVNGTGVNQIGSSSPTVVFSTGTWYLVTFITQRSATANTTKIYVNTTLYVQNAWGNDGYSESNPLQLGGGYGGYVNCKIGAFYFYNRGLSATEIQQNFDATRTRYGV